MKRFFAILLALTIMVTGTTGIYAKGNDNIKDNNKNNHQNEDKARTLYDLGLFNGTSSTSYVPELDVLATRVQALKLIGTSLGWDLPDVKSVPGYTDVPEWAAPYVAYALENNITKGIGHNKFGSNLPVNKRMIYTWYYRALLFTDDAWENSDFLVSAGLITQAEADLIKTSLASTTDTSVIRDTLVGIMFESLQWKEHGSNQRLIQKLINNHRVDEKKARDCGLYPNNDLLTFKLKADSLKAVTVEFSKTLNASTVTSALFDVKVNGIAKTAETDYTVETIDKTVYIIFKDLLTQVPVTTVTVSVKDGIKSTTGVAVTTEPKTVTVNDNVAPITNAAALTNANTVKIYFSEPMNIVANAVVGEVNYVLIDGIKAIGTTSFNASKTVLTLQLLTALTGSNHSIVINAGLPDFFGLNTLEKTFQVSQDVTAPSIVSVTATDKDHLVIQFNEPINSTEGTILVDQVLYPVTAGTVDGNVLKLPLTKALLSDSATVGTTLTIYGIKDLKNNAVDLTVGVPFLFKAAIDNVAPTATVQLLVNKTIKVQFSEAIDAFTALDYVLVNSTGVVTPSTVIYNATEKNAIITFTTAPVSGTYTLSILDTVLDNSVYQNKFVTQVSQLVVN